ncbi:MAG: response regulator [bacterium]
MSKPKILVVDDDERILFAFNELLEKEGYESIEARDGAEALKKFETEQPQVVLLDLAIPIIDGFEALKEIKKKNEMIPIIVITGQGTQHSAEEVLKQGAFEYLTKPVSIKKIRKVIRKALSRK